jgi:hypothetical protein
MRFIDMAYDIKDRRAGYQRQEDEPETYHCDCGARVLRSINSMLVHVRECTISEEDNND